ncbi:zinc-binding dehydrogenase [Neorhizobium sp. JUb45]|uniref:zinc-binding dehydrogenase n=1 Tax=Neorhizobium sp. JUb45 TaxID=2485113 RepID=UPI00104610AF|nr:zinc-binding dehydrogenase [Neorhizobium sp. JUb45]TCR06371.1 NADPH:quinone reductase-like Zn-dependent oxidoreductase [Neorhizobium sp. JUb45]
MRSAIYSQFGTPLKVLTIEDRPVPEPGPGEVRIRMAMAAIHNHDLLTIEGKYGSLPALPAVAGTEATGTVDALGEGVTHLKIGQRVAVSGKGTWADYYLASAAMAVPLPDSIHDTAAAQLISMPLSALTLLDFVGAEKGDWLIQNAANGAVGKTLAMFAKKRGIRVVNLVRRDDAVSELADLGIEDVVSTTQEGWRETVRAITGGAPIKAGVDGVGGPASGELVSTLGDNGLLVSFGLMSGQPMQLSASDMIFKQATVKGFWLAKIAPTLPVEKLKSMIGEIVESVAKGEVELTVSDVFDLSDVAKAAAAAGETGRKGKVLIRG